MSIADRNRIDALEARIVALEATVAQLMQSKVSDPQKGETKPAEVPPIAPARETLKVRRG